MYCEQVGWYLHVAGVMGDMSVWYTFIRNKKGAISSFLIQKCTLKRVQLQTQKLIFQLCHYLNDDP